MTDFSLEWSGDLILTVPKGGITLVSDADLTRQRLIRRLLTNPGDYIFDTNYGAGLGRFIGSPINVNDISGLVNEQALLENTVDEVISVTVNSDNIGYVNCTIIYTDKSDTGIQQILSLTVTPTGYQI
jgi:phage baseplate assembly protein W